MKVISRALIACLLSTLAAMSATPTFKAVEVDTKIEIGYGVTVADVNGDRKPDILLADKNAIVWYENPNWEKHVIAEKLTTLDHVCIAAADIDGDGKCEIAVGAGWNPNDTVNSGALFYLVAPGDRTQKWDPIKLPHEPTIHRIRWVKNPSGKFDLLSVPLHGRGNKPATGEGDGVKILALKKPSDPKDPWISEVVNESLHKTHNFDPIQWEGEAGQQLLIASKEGVALQHRVRGILVSTLLTGTESGGAGEVRLGKLAGGKRFIATVEPMHGTNLVIYTEPATAGKLWTRHVVDSTLLDGHALACGDLSGSGTDQVVVGWRAMGREDAKVGIKLFSALDAAGSGWKESLVDDNTMACEDLCLADLDGDGKLDIIASGRATKNVKVYFNQGAK
ncbi:MAG: hypothetical protein QOF48_2964 [Verrucomicrobiota bacterium]|jgi:hypothetical protein